MISRFFFNISIFETLKYLFAIFFFNKKDLTNNLNSKLSTYFNNSNFYYFDHGRTALYETLCELRKKTGKEKILVNSLTLFEIINTIIYSGFKPQFVDTKENSFETTIDLNKLDTDINNIAAIIITHLNGANKNILELKKQIDSHNKSNEKIYLIEDCAVSFGAKINGKYVGNYGDYSFLSFNIMKNITSFTGGVLIDKKINNINFNTSHYKLPSKINIIKKIIFVLIIQILNSKIIFPIFFKLIKISYRYSFNFFLKKYRTDFEINIEKTFPKRFRNLMHNFQKYIVLHQFDSLETKQNLRINKSKIYYENLKNINLLHFPQVEFNNLNIFLDFPIICEKQKIQKDLFHFLLDNKMDVKNYYYTNCSEKNIYKYDNRICSNSKKISENILMLPLHEKINKDKQMEIINKIIEFFNNNKFK